MTKQIIPSYGKNFFAYEYFLNKQQDVLLLTSDDCDATRAYQQIQFFHQQHHSGQILYLPSFDTIPYDRVSPKQDILSTRAKVLTDLATTIKEVKLLITNSINLLHKLPPTKIFAASSLELYKGMKLTTIELANFLVLNSFNRSSTATDHGEFAVRGEIVDIALPDAAYRINFAWGERIESIKQFDLVTQISTIECQHVAIYPASEIILNPETINNFKDNYLLNFGVNHTNQPLYQSIIAAKKFVAYEHLLPLFYKELNGLVDYLKNPVIIYDPLAVHALLEYENTYHDLYESRLLSNKTKLTTFYPALPPTECCITYAKIKEILEQSSNICLEYAASTASPLNLSATSFVEQKTIFEKLFEIISSNPTKIPVIFFETKINMERIKQIIKNYDYLYADITNLEQAKIGIVNLCYVPLAHGFHSENYIFIAEHDIFKTKPPTTTTNTAKRRLKNILTELDNLQEGELVVHTEHGIGQFIAVETIQVGGNPHDCLKILYADNDRLYVPVENIELVKKYGNFEAELDKLGSIGWQKRKAKLKNRINETATQLLQLAARRKLISAPIITFETPEFAKFCSGFQYVETEDQLKAIADIKDDLTSGLLMDRLICGDVGFGKTEVAMRATYMTIANTDDPLSQVAIIAPTTILCKQHYLRFTKRFKSHGFKVAQLSRLVSPSDTKQNKELIKNGEVNIIVGTHALLASEIKFHNLKMIIIDEEQHFGVKQKERLKELKSDIHVLSLSATPIPRTLQMSMVGLKDLSLIATPPVDRLAVRTVVMPFDPVVIRDALLRERFRGGQSFYVCPRIKDIEYIEQKLKEMVPELKYKIAHGQMLPSVTDKIMEEFYHGQFDILLSTTIIESGIDIPTTNTMIIHKADQLGLSQLYQLRGRIGRSKVRAYAYLTIADDKKITAHSVRRLNIIQNADALGSGFVIASHDMDLRGFGNLVGEEQSGQIKEVGVELYQEMLDQQIANLKDLPESSDNFMPSINLGVPVFIPNDYIADSALKLGIYKRIGNLLADHEVEEFYAEMLDRFGSIPIELDNLLNIVKIKYICRKLQIESLDSGTQGFVLKFAKRANVADMVMKFIDQYPRQAKIKPDNKLVFVKDLDQATIINEASTILQQLAALVIPET
ncbi:Transcription-repair-coupling factor [Candidatus Trichorickettsia mobilis]|uniref:Transcription-repair-coupling factor n=1 Tax=Candidatus Trichorickettsia mobilis TaxID=1346319 RepID=A0ABZ0UV14_9RICK|nr:transcription-repair coupling factor [Candidatus Trichorickettsia mobilis]WPY01456.1 Transcription-repair-coupling factor [Candidatus Trichorickettsia mobilis]